MKCPGCGGPRARATGLCRGCRTVARRKAEQSARMDHDMVLLSWRAAGKTFAGIGAAAGGISREGARSRLLRAAQRQGAPSSLRPEAISEWLDSGGIVRWVEHHEGT